MKKQIPIVVLTMITISLFVALSGCTVMQYKKEISSTSIEAIDLNRVADGKYEGFYDVYYLNARVEVSVQNHHIVDIRLVEHKHDKHSGEPMIQKVIDAQSLDVDTISGATNSCKTVLKAIEIALSKGETKK